MSEIDFSASRDAFRNALWELGIYGRTAETAADLFAKVVPRTMLELVPEELAAATARAGRAETMADTWICKAGEYEGIMADQRIALERAEAAEADLRRVLRDVGNHLSTEHEVRHLHDHLGENLGCAGCALLENVRAALFGPTDTEGADRG